MRFDSLKWVAPILGAIATAASLVGFGHMWGSQGRGAVTREVEQLRGGFAAQRREFIDAISIPIVVWDIERSSDGRALQAVIADGNQSAARLYGTTPERLRGMTGPELRKLISQRISNQGEWLEEQHRREIEHLAGDLDEHARVPMVFTEETVGDLAGRWYLHTQWLGRSNEYSVTRASRTCN